VEINDSHEGVLGIVAGKLREKVNRPVVVISRNADTYKGTGRSIPTVDLFSMLDKYRSDFISFGGHSAACGFTIPADKADTLRRSLNLDIAEMYREDSSIFDVDYECDAYIEPEDVGLELAEAVQLLEPCGKDNEVPVFVIRNPEISGWKYLKNEEKMAKFAIRTSDGRSIDCVLFHDAAEAYDAVCSGPVDIYGNIEINTWRDERKAQIIVRHILPEQGEA
jgi:single-stranded-DNA-specific exonuclease